MQLVGFLHRVEDNTIGDRQEWKVEIRDSVPSIKNSEFLKFFLG